MKNEFIIKHDDIDVCVITFTSGCRIEQVCKIINSEHLPPYILYSAEQNVYKYDEWFGGRAIARNREGLETILQKYNVNSPRELLLKNYALSLYDHYWVCPADKNLKWKDINFFDNKFKEDAGNILIGGLINTDIDELTPESSSGGTLSKKWEWKDGNTYLIKRGSGYYRQEPFNEVIASQIMKRLNINGVDYTLEWKGGEPRCRCKNMLNGENELIHSWDLVHEMKVNVDKYASFLKMSENAGIGNIKQELDKMLVLDYIIANTDRHFNNIGFLRNAHTLEYSGLAPVYDSGASLWHDKNANEIIKEKNCPCKPFKGNHHDQIKKVRSLDWFDAKSLDGIDSLIYEGFSNNDKIDDTKKSATISILRSKIKEIERLREDRIRKQEYSHFDR